MSKVQFPGNDGGELVIVTHNDEEFAAPIPDGEEAIDFAFGTTSELMVHHLQVSRALRGASRFGLAGLHGGYWEDDSRWISLTLLRVSSDSPAPSYQAMCRALTRAGFRESYAE